MESKRDSMRLRLLFPSDKQLRSYLKVRGLDDTPEDVQKFKLILLNATAKTVAEFSKEILFPRDS